MQRCWIALRGPELASGKYRCMSAPASIAPEPNNYEFISSRSVFFFFWLAEQRIHSKRSQRTSLQALLHGEKSSDSTWDTKATVPGSPSFSGLSDCCIYLQRRLRSVSPASAPHCVSIQPRSGRQTAPLPFQTAAGRQPKQKAPSANRKRGDSSTLKSDQSGRAKGGPDTELQIQLMHFLVVFSSDSELVPMAYSSVSIVKCT